mmetsp:Transcript_10003/g.25817  ORF Transcript_10003/g.25817 Transcript_10003/m.25817 type:complete len:253 (+) Transcript_10003:779-1537(+)
MRAGIRAGRKVGAALRLVTGSRVVCKVGEVNEAARAASLPHAAAAFAAVVQGANVGAAVYRVHLGAIVVAADVHALVVVGTARVRRAAKLGSSVEAVDEKIIGVAGLGVVAALAGTVEILGEDGVRQVVATGVGAVAEAGAALRRRAAVARTRGEQIPGHIGAGVLVAAGALAVQEGGVDLCVVVRADVLALRDSGPASVRTALVAPAREEGRDVPIVVGAPLAVAALARAVVVVGALGGGRRAGGQPEQRR